MSCGLIDISVSHCLSHIFMFRSLESSYGEKIWWRVKFGTFFNYFSMEGVDRACGGLLSTVNSLACTWDWRFFKPHPHALRVLGMESGALLSSIYSDCKLSDCNKACFMSSGIQWNLWAKTALDMLKCGLCRQVVFAQRYIWLGQIRKSFRWVVFLQKLVFCSGRLCLQVSLYRGVGYNLYIPQGREWEYDSVCTIKVRNHTWRRYKLYPT